MAWLTLRRCAVATFALLAPVVLAAPATASASGRWSVARDASGTTIRWVAPADLPATDARPVFRLAGRSLGAPRVDGRVLELRVPAALAAGARLSVWLGDRRLDGPTPAPTPGRAPAAGIPAGPIGGAVAHDPARPGPYAVREVAYTAAGFHVTGYRVPLETVGDVIYPIGAPGARPLVLFLHGRHGTCYRGDASSLDWPCRTGWRPIPSQLGYRYLQRRLASQGYVTVSIAANAVNAQDAGVPDAGAEARAALIRHHLDLIARWSSTGGAPLGNRLRGKVDVTRTILVGHSRGGEGIERAAVDGPTAGAAWRIRGLVPIAPTAFGRQAALGVPTAVILPSCDGDVSDLQGQAYVDSVRDRGVGDTALRSAVLVVGASHNLFNTEWTPGLAVSDGFDDSSCSGSPRHLAPSAEQRVGTTYVAALVHAALDADPDAISLLDGSRVHAASAGSATVLSSALGGRRALVFHAGDGAHVGYHRATATVCAGYLDRGDHRTTCTDGSSPHWTPPLDVGSPPALEALAVRWAGSGAAVAITLPAAAPRAGATDLDLRVILDPRAAPLRLTASLGTSTGGTVVLKPVTGTARPLPAISGSTVLWAQTLRFRLPAGDATYTRLDLHPGSSSGRLWLLDAALRSPGLAPLAPLAVAKVDVGQGSVVEGDGERRVLAVPLRVRGTVPAGAKIWLATAFTAGLHGTPQRLQVAIPPGATHVTVRVPFRGNRYFDVPAEHIWTVAFGDVGTVTGAYVRASAVKDDDPRPGLLLRPRAITVHEGELVRIRVTATRPVGPFASLMLTAVAGPAGQRALGTDDLTEHDREAWGVFEPTPERALWRADLMHDTSLTPALGSVTVAFRPRRDGVTEGPEHLRLRLSGYQVGTILPKPLDVDVTVLDG